VGTARSLLFRERTKAAIARDAGNGFLSWMYMSAKRVRELTIYAGGHKVRRANWDKKFYAIVMYVGKTKVFLRIMKNGKFYEETCLKNVCGSKKWIILDG